MWQLLLTKSVSDCVDYFLFGDSGKTAWMTQNAILSGSEWLSGDIIMVLWWHTVLPVSIHATWNPAWNLDVTIQDLEDIQSMTRPCWPAWLTHCHWDTFFNVLICDVTWSPYGSQEDIDTMCVPVQGIAFSFLLLCSLIAHRLATVLTMWSWR